MLCSGCSIHPLHEKIETEVQNRIYVSVIAGKNGQVLRGYLQDLIRDLDVSDKHCVLSVNLREDDIRYALADDGNNQRLKINLTADVTLRDSEGKDLVVTSVYGSTTRNIASAQGDVLLSMYDKANGIILKDLAFRIIENLKVALIK